MTDAVALHAAVRDRLAVRPLVLLLDVDGTLSPIAPTPDAAIVPADTRAALARLAASPGVHVALVSGRAAADARRLVGVAGVWAVGNHGFERIAPDGTVESDPVVARWRPRVAAAAAAIAPQLAAHPGAVLEDKEWTLSVHYRNAAAGADAEIGSTLARVADAHGLRLTEGKKVFELRPPLHVDKGTASLALLHHLAGGASAAVLYAGDDRTDEDAFAALRTAVPGAITIRIAPATDDAPVTTTAEFLLPHVEAMGAFLGLLAR